MKAAAAQAGLDPALVERAARLLRSNAVAAPSFMERLIGGRTRHGSEAHFPIFMDEARAAELLSALRIGVGRSGAGLSGPTGVTWRSSDDWGSVLSITALADDEGTSVKADLDRRGTLVVFGGLTLVGSFMALAFGGTVAGEMLPGLEVVGGLTGAGAVLALARSFWSSSTKTARERLDSVMDCVNRFHTSGNATSTGSAGRQADTSGAEGKPAGDAG